MHETIQPVGKIGFQELVEVRGHILDSLILPKILDLITGSGGRFRMVQVSIGQTRHDPSYACIEVQADARERLDEILARIADHGAVSVAVHDVHLEPADMDGAFPEGFYSTTNQRTEIRIRRNWIGVELQEMDCGIAVEPDLGRACCIPMHEVQRGQLIVVGHMGVGVHPVERGEARHGFEFMNSPVSTEKPKGAATRQIARELFDRRQRGEKILVVGGPAIVHTGSTQHFVKLIQRGYIHKLFAGNALATHDVEHAFFGTSLGVKLESGDIVEAGHEHHLRAINRIRRLGGLRRAVEQGILSSGIMHACLKRGVDLVLAGSIRDDGPLPEVITDTLVAQQEMRTRVRDVTFCLMIATTLHSIAVGNLLPAEVRVVCVDINPSTVIKLSDRGSFQTVGLVTDVEPFLRSLVSELEALEQHAHETSSPDVSA